MGLNDRKRKSITTTMQGNDKKRKSVILKKSSSSEDSDEQIDQDNGLNFKVKTENPEISRWPQDDVRKLLHQMELILPKNDSTTFRSRLAKVDWEKVKFDNYTKDECQSTWLAILDQLRTFKTLGDLVNDAKIILATKGIDTYLSKQNRLQKPKSAYMLYYIDIQPKYKEKYPDLKLPKLTQIIAEKYKVLSPEKKQFYIDQAQKLRTEYLELVDKTNLGFKPELALIESNKLKSTSKLKPTPTPKSKTPFQIFLESKSTGNSSVDKTELQNHLKEKWDNMSEKKKSKWIKLANEREQVYLNNLKEDHKNDPAFTLPTRSALTKGDRNILDSQSGKPKKPPVNSYGLYSKEMLQSNALDGVPPKERMTVLATKWKAFSEEERQIYSDRLKVIAERYKTEYDAYLKTLPENERQIEMAKNKVKPKKVVPRINAREGIIEKPKKKEVSKFNRKTMMFKNEPKGVPYKNAFEYYRSKIRPNEKHQITSLEEWNSKADKKRVKYENELKVLKKEYMKNLKVFLKSLSEDDLKLYLKLRKPELVTEKTDRESSESENEDSSSEEDDDNDNNDEDDDDDDEDNNDNDDEEDDDSDDSDDDDDSD